MSTTKFTDDIRSACCCTAPDPSETPTWRHGRTIGPWGTMVRALAGLAAIALGVIVPHKHPLFDLPGSSSIVLGTLLGLVAVPAVLTGLIWARGRTATRLHLGPGAACVVTLLSVAGLQIYPIVAWVVIGAPLLLSASIGRSGCELLTIPNLLLRRSDYLFCLPFTPVDTWERRRRGVRSRHLGDLEQGASGGEDLLCE